MRVARTVSLTRDGHRGGARTPSAGPGEVVCRVLACATCGSDVQDFYVSRKLPAVLGHEPAGEVVEVGAGVTGVAARRPRRDPPPLALRRVPALPPRPRDAVRALPLDAPRPRRLRRVRAHPGRAGRRAAAARRHGPGARHLHRAAGVRAARPAPRRASSAGDAAARGRRGRERAAQHRRRPRERGRGGMGARAAARSGSRAPSAGARPRTATSRSTSRSSARRATRRSPRAADALAPGGALCVYAPPPPGSPLAIDGNAVFMRELDVTASWSAGPADMQRALGLLAREAVRPLELMTHRFALERDRRGARGAAQRRGAQGRRTALGVVSIHAGDRARHVRPGRRPRAAARSSGPRSATTRCSSASTRPASTAASGTSWPACRTRSASRATGCGRPRTPVPGMDVAGVVEAVGSRRDAVPAGRRGLRRRHGRRSRSTRALPRPSWRRSRRT